MAAFILFHLFLRQWFADDLAFWRTLFLVATVPLTFNNWTEIPTDFIEIIVFTVGLWLAYRDAMSRFCVTVFVGALNRESAAVLPFFSSSCSST